MAPRPARPTRAEYVDWRTATTRWSDDDVYGHLNNARYFDLIDTAVNAHLAEATGTDIRRLPAIGVVAEVSCRYFAEMGYPRPIELGLVVERLGTSSVIESRSSATPSVRLRNSSDGGYFVTFTNESPL